MLLLLLLLGQRSGPNSSLSQTSLTWDPTKQRQQAVDEKVLVAAPLHPDALQSQHTNYEAQGQHC